MRQLLLLSFALLPVAAHAQLNNGLSVAPAPTPSIMISAAGNPARAKAPGKPEVDSSTPLITTRQTLRTTVDSDFAYPEEGSSTTLGSPNFVEAPKLEKFSTIAIAQEDLAKVPAETTVAVSMTVDAQGVPHDLHIEHSAGQTIDSDAMATVSQYRFTPASVDHVPTAAEVTVNVTIDKSNRRKTGAVVR